MSRQKWIDDGSDASNIDEAKEVDFLKADIQLLPNMAIMMDNMALAIKDLGDKFVCFHNLQLQQSLPNIP
jgi:hypothetical protein